MKFSHSAAPSLPNEPVTWALKLLESDKVVDAMCSELMVVQPALTQENIGHVVYEVNGALANIPAVSCHDRECQDAEICECVILAIIWDFILICDQWNQGPLIRGKGKRIHWQERGNTEMMRGVKRSKVLIMVQTMQIWR